MAKQILVPPLNHAIVILLFRPENIYDWNLPANVAQDSANQPEPSVHLGDVGDHVTLDEGVILLVFGDLAVPDVDCPTVAK